MQAGGGKKLAEKTEIPFLGSIPLDCRISECADEGIPIVYKYPDSEPARIFKNVAEWIERQL
jgi:ATP-binding protein involved in chromosome partitioning